MPTEDAYSSGHLVLSHLGFANVLLLRPLTQSYITPVYDTFPWLDFIPNLTLLLNTGFHRASATGVACRQGALTPPDTWSCPTLGLACVLMSRPITPELVLSPDFWISNTPRYFSFAFNKLRKHDHLAKTRAECLTILLVLIWFLPKFTGLICVLTFANKYRKVLFGTRAELIYAKLKTAIYFNIWQLICWWTSESPRVHVAKFYGRLRLIRSILRASKFAVLRHFQYGKWESTTIRSRYIYSFWKLRT